MKRMALVVVGLAAGCGEGSQGARPDAAATLEPDAGVPGCPLPADGVYATFLVAGEETYRAQITSQTGIDGAIALWRGQSSAAIPSGELVCSPAPWNCGWTWHQDPATIEFADFTIEVCDGVPSYVEDNCAGFGAQYCPWSAVLVDLRDCRTDAACPQVTR